MSHVPFVFFDDSSSSLDDDPIMDLDGNIIPDETVHGDQEPSDGESVGDEKKDKEEENEEDDEEDSDSFVVRDDAPILYEDDDDDGKEPPAKKRVKE